MCNKKRLDNTEIDLKITDLILTPATCALLVNEILKYLVYQKSQIPYPYAWLKSVICRKRKSLENGGLSHSNPSISRNYKIASAAYDIIEEVMKNVILQFRENGNNIIELIVLFGATIYTPKEIIRFVIPQLDNKHLDMNHVTANERNKNKVLRNLFLSEDWIKAMELTHPCTNMFLLINKNVQHPTDESAFFLPMRNYEYSQSTRHITVNFLYDQYDGSCCLNLQVYTDISEGNVLLIDNILNENSGSNNYWYQAKLSLKGFKDCYINKQSASDLF